MKKIIKTLLSVIAGFFNRMADQEAERVIRYYNQIFVSNQEGGRSEKIKRECMSNPKLYSSPIRKGGIKK